MHENMINMYHQSKEIFFNIIDTDERMNLAFCLLSHLFPGKKSTKGGRASIQEALDNFIDFQKVIIAMRRFMAIPKKNCFFFFGRLGRGSG